MLDDLIKWFIGLFVSDTTVNSIANKAASVMNYSVINIISVKYIVLFILGLVAIYALSYFRYRKNQMLKTIGKCSDKVYGGFLYKYKESDDGKKFELSLDESYVADIPIGTSEFGIKNEIIIDSAALVEYKDATEPYRVSKMSYYMLTAFGSLPYLKNIDTSKLENLVSQWRTDFRSISLTNLSQMPEEERERLSFKYTLLIIATDVLAIGQDITLLRSLPFYRKNVRYFSTNDDFLINPQDTPIEIDQYQQLHKELMRLNSVLVRGIVLQEYFNAESASSFVSSRSLNSNNAAEVLFVSIPMYLSDKEKLVSVIVLKPSLYIATNVNEVMFKLKKRIIKYRSGMRIQRAINNIVFRKNKE